MQSPVSACAKHVPTVSVLRKQKLDKHFHHYKHPSRSLPCCHASRRGLHECAGHSCGGKRASILPVLSAPHHHGLDLATSYEHAPNLEADQMQVCKFPFVKKRCKGQLVKQKWPAGRARQLKNFRYGQRAIGFAWLVQNVCPRGQVWERHSRLSTVRVE